VFAGYERNGVIGIVGGLAIFAIVFVPLLLMQIRRYGRVSGLRVLGAVAVSIYGVALAAYTLFPLPSDTTTVCVAPLQLVPFHFVDDVIREGAGQPFLTAITSDAVIEYLFNIALFVPLGVIVRRYFSRGAGVATAAGFAISLLIESTQYTGIWGVYSCAYRFADVDDLIANTAGAILGAFIAPRILRWMPGDSDLRPRRLTPRPVTAGRRWLGMLFDWVLFSLLGSVLSILGVGVPRALGATVPEWVSPLVSTLLPGLLVFLLPALHRSGASFGQRAVWLTLDWGSRAPTLGRRLARASVPLVWTVLLTVSSLDPRSVLALGAALAGMLAVAEVITVGATRGRGIGTAIAGARFVDSRG